MTQNATSIVRSEKFLMIKRLPNISVNTERCKRRSAPPAPAGYVNR